MYPSFFRRMMRLAWEHRRTAREALKGMWGVVFPVMLIASAVDYGLGVDTAWRTFFAETRVLWLPNGMGYQYYVPVGPGVALMGVSLVITLISLVVAVGRYRAARALLQREQIAAGQLFPMRLLGKVLLMNLVRMLLVAVQGLLLIVPGVIAAFRYSMADYLMAENPELGPIEALRESRMRMRGNKAALFFLRFSYLGWVILNAVVVQVLIYALPDAPAAEFVYVALLCLMDAPLTAYVTVGETAFFMRVSDGTNAVDAPEDGSEMTQEAYGAATEGDPDEVYTALSADETVAKDMFLQHGCSRARLRDAGLLEEYEQLRVQPSSEAAWARDYGDSLVRRFDRDPEVLDELLALSAEYASPGLIDRTLQRIDRHIRQQTLPDAEILDMAGRALAMLTSGVFDGDGGFLGRKCAQVSDMADRLEHRLEQEQPDGGWRRALELIRSMCGGNEG